MILESAFLKIPEILLSNDDTDSLYEAYIASVFSNAILLELNSKNISDPMKCINLEKRYKKGENIRCDMYLDFSGIINKKMNIYGVNEKNWVEFKYFGGIDRNEGNETTTENPGKIMFDIFRLLQYAPKDEAKYFINIFNDKPNKYLALKRQNGSEREWMACLLKSGLQKIEFILDEEPNTIKKVFKGVANLKLEVTLRNLVFEPIKISKSKNFYGYLNQIIDFKIISKKNE